MNFFETDKFIRKIKANNGVALARNVPCCSLVTGTEPMEMYRYIPMNLINSILLSRDFYKVQQFPLPLEVVTSTPGEAIDPAAFTWGRRYKGIGCFLENPSTPGYGNIYQHSPSWIDRPITASEGSFCSAWVKYCLPSLDLVEWWEQGGDDGHTDYHRVGHAIVPTKLWNAGDGSAWCRGEFDNYPYPVSSCLSPFNSEEEYKHCVSFLSEFVQPVGLDRATH